MSNPETVQAPVRFISSLKGSVAFSGLCTDHHILPLFALATVDLAVVGVLGFALLLTQCPLDWCHFFILVLVNLIHQWQLAHEGAGVTAFLRSTVRASIERSCPTAGGHLVEVGQEAVGRGWWRRSSRGFETQVAVTSSFNGHWCTYS